MRSLLKIWLRGERLIREGGLIKRGLNRAFTVMMKERLSWIESKFLLLGNCFVKNHPAK